MTTPQAQQEKSTASRFVEELRKIHDQWTIPATIMMALRGRIERLSGVQLEHRIGGAYPNGDLSVLLVGSAGTGKTVGDASLARGSWPQ